ncbi:30S ribosomal protein S1 [Granulicatella adiacens]|jgi:30S ribosomal protein S1|uniref:30S ribosomal protein S1 n=3 Tax=Carnobacteriaceae TaxID=186828 RepID=UPI00066C9A5B|nr:MULTISPECIES: 30S ribosomal protein S1 [Granulicatella]MBF1210858.1 30S ribosomal protein S1 [Granulicatella sp.]MCT2160252.1 30S ribosomal protein S1 [Granulicatella adiacens]OFT00614.1 30S ribosomal protein S1 [Granulicatella sp. HMSC31F03]OFT80977.1 30S ribosomal protein S1 [Granulicatella sp. HMSC30F09]RKW26859.1 MAG: 30S ribosomal protein S1 [Granulicatella sp.]
MSELQTMQDALDIVKDIQIGDLVQGEVLTLQDKQAIVGIIGGGVEGVIPFNELSTSPVERVEDVLSVGDVVDLVVIKQIKDKENGSFLLSKKRVDARKVWEEIQAKFDNKEIIEAPVVDAVKGGLVVDAGVRAFVPASMVSDHYVDNLAQFKGQTLAFEIVEIEPSENRLILSRKNLVAAEKAAKRAAVFESIQEGSVVTGKVARLTNFGAFIDLGGVDGLVHISQISHEHVAKASDKLEVGQEVQAKVISVDPESGRVSLSIKDTLAGPWDNIEERAAVGSVLDGLVKRLTTFGAFVELFPGVEGLVHISQIAHQHIATPHEVLKEGQEVQVKVLEVHPEQQRISLSIKALQEAPKPEKEEVEEVVEETYELPEEDVSFSLADRLGDQLSELKVEE